MKKKKLNYSIRINKDFLPNFFSCYALDENGYEIGYAHVLLYGDKAKLADIYVKEHCLQPWLNFFPFFMREQKFRNHGVGSSLLKEVIKCCSCLGVSQLTGDISGDELRLARFYRSFGFKVNGLKILLELEPVV